MTLTPEASILPVCPYRSVTEQRALTSARGGKPEHPCSPRAPLLQEAPSRMQRSIGCGARMAEPGLQRE